MGQSDSKPPQTICSVCGKPTDVSFTFMAKLNTGPQIQSDICPSCLSSQQSEVKKQLADYSPES
jgi:hypothetical protein